MSEKRKGPQKRQIDRTVYLIGFMGSGKSTVSRQLAEYLSVKQLEMDDILTAQAGKSITRIFEEDGEEAFRRMESELIRRIGSEEPAVVSCGGGVVLRRENAENMKKNGIVVFLSAEPQTIYERVKNSTHRPVLNGHMNVEYIAQLMEKRAPFYEAAADITVFVDNKSSAQVAKEILKRISQAG